MAITNIRVMSTSPGTLVARLYNDRFTEFYVNAATIQAVVLGSYQGFRQISWSAVKGGNTTNYFYVLNMQGATEVFSALAYLQSYGWNQFTGFVWGAAGQPATFAAGLTFWQQNYMAYRQALIDNWTNSFISAQSVHSITYLTNQQASFCASYQITTDSLTFVDVANGAANLDENISHVDGIFGLDFALINAAYGSIASGNQLGKIANALTDIADQDYNISINHGQSIFSVKGKVTT